MSARRALSRPLRDRLSLTSRSLLSNQLWYYTDWTRGTNKNESTAFALYLFVHTSRSHELIILET